MEEKSRVQKVSPLDRLFTVDYSYKYLTAIPHDFESRNSDVCISAAGTKDIRYSYCIPQSQR